MPGHIPRPLGRAASAEDRAGARLLTERREHLRPVEYPEFLAYRDAIRHSYWLHTEYNLMDDVQDFRTRISRPERSVITNTMLAIAQVEVAVKTFWGDLIKHYPKPEIGAVGYTFAESEVRHQDAYAHLLELLGLNGEFRRLPEIPALHRRVDFLNEFLRQRPTGDPERDGRERAFIVLLFSAFVEHVSLFGQFLIMKSFNRERNLFKGIANLVEATSKEEQIHAMFGYKLIETLRGEFPGWFDDEFFERVRRACRSAFEAESAILDWIFEEGELDFLPKATVEAFIQHRFNASLQSVSMEPLWHPDPNALESTRWFEEEVVAGKHYDFFHKRPTTYSRKTKSITGDDLFD
jgi:ribonucleoside-diphosphate reductase beta chain